MESLPKEQQEVSDEELEARMRRKLFGGSRAGEPIISEDERRMRQALLGRDNAARLAKHRDVRPFRPKPVVVTFEFYEFTAGSRSFSFDGWRMNRVENGRPELYKEFRTEDECIQEVLALRRKGYSVKEFKLDRPRRRVPQPSRTSSKRMEIIGQLKEFRP